MAQKEIEYAVEENDGKNVHAVFSNKCCLNKDKVRELLSKGGNGQLLNISDNRRKQNVFTSAPMKQVEI